jgi:hypothetical protein
MGLLSARLPLCPPFLILAILIYMVGSPPSRRWLFEVVTILAILLVPCCWLLFKVGEIRAEREAVERIEKTGGRVGYAEASGLLRKILGEEWSRRVARVDCGPETSDADLRYLKALPELVRLYLNETAITDAGLEHLKGMTQLRWLKLDDTAITDAGLEHLKGLYNLDALVLEGTKVSDEGVKELRKALPKCDIVR